jgi:hypothetical protein
MFLLKFLGFNTGPIRGIESAGLHLGWGWAGLILTLLVMVPVAWLTYRCEGKNIPVAMRRRLLSLRLVWIVLLALLLTGPVLVISGWIPQKNRLAVLLDTSRSMSIKFQGESRLERVKKLFNRGFVKKIEDKTGIFPEVFSFADNVSPVSRQEVEQFNFAAEGNQTDISGALRNLMGNLGEGSLLGVIMLTDGVSTTGENPLTALSNMRTPIYSVAPGADGEAPDLALHLPKPPALGYLNSSVRVRGEVSLHRLATSAVEVTITRDGKPFTTAIASFAADTGRAPFAFSIPCDTEGSFRFEMTIPGVADELTADNNSAGFLLKVVRERLNVLALSGRPTWDMKFIGNALSTDPNARLTHWVRIRDDRWVCSRDFKPERAVSTLNLSDDLKNADVVVLNGVPHSFLQPVEAELIKRLEAGSIGMLVLPSGQTFAELGYAGTEIGARLPVNIGDELWRGNPGNMVLPSSETPYNFLRLVDDPIQNLEFFATLPKFDGLYEYSGLKPGAEILIRSTVRGASDLLPFMLQSRAGQGHVIMLAGGPVWPLGFRLVPTDRGISPFSAMMVNMFKWLANRREDAQISLELPSSRGYVGQATSVRVWVLDSKNQLQANAQVTITVRDEKNTANSIQCIETSERGCYEAAFVPAFRGLHKIEAEARYQGRELGRTTGEMLVEMPTAEFDEPVIKEAMLRQLASETGGLFATDADAEKIIAAIDSVPGQKLESRSLDLRDSWLLLLVLLLLPMAEWYLRRTGGLS